MSVLRSSVAFGAACEEVAPPAGVLDVRIRVALDDFFDRKPGLPQKIGHFFRSEKMEVDRHRVPPPFVQVDRLTTNMKRQEKPAARP